MSRSPLRRLADELVLASMRPPIAPQLMSYRPGQRDIDLDGKRILITGASSGIGEAAADQVRPPGRHRRRRRPPQGPAGRASPTGSLADGGDALAIDCDLADLDAVDALAARVEKEIGGVDILVNNAGRSIRRPLAESLDRWHDVERTMTLNYYSPLRLIRALAPGMLERGDGHVINVATWGVLSESTPLFAVYNASKAALSAVSRVIETEWAHKGVHSTTLYYPLVATPMIAPTKAYDGLPALTPGRGRRLDGDRRPRPAGAHRAADGRHGQGSRHRRARLAQRADQAATTTARRLTRLCGIPDRT